jgi:hypothetical protein
MHGFPQRWLAAGLLFALPATVAAQDEKLPRVPAGDLVRAVVKNEIADADDTTIRHSFRSRKQTPKGSQTHLYVETNDAIAAMLIAINDQPLTPQQQQQETNHLNWLMGNPEALRKKHSRENEDAERSLRIVKSLPDAFRYEYAGTEDSNGTMGKQGSPLLRVNFKPNPSYSPPSRVEQVLAGMEGYLLIDPSAQRLAVISGTLFRDVQFGWGIIGHLDKGGHFLVRQADLGDGSWEITEMKLDIGGKILLFKSISMVSDEVFTDFRRVPDDLTFSQGVNLLMGEREKLAHSEHSAGTAESKKTPQ